MTIITALDPKKDHPAACLAAEAGRSTNTKHLGRNSMSKRHLTEDHKRLADLMKSAGMHSAAEEILSHPRRYPRPAWQRRILHAVSPSYRARGRRVAEFTRLVAMATRAHEREQAGPQVDISAGAQ